MFTSYEFIIFMLAVIAVYYLVPKRFQWMLLLVANFLFYYSAGPSYPIFILVTSFTVYLAGWAMGRKDEQLNTYLAKIKSGEMEQPSKEEKKAYKKWINQKKKVIMLLCLILNIGILTVVKYTNFAVENINVLLDMTGKQTLSYVDLILPMGISFYTFQAVGYLLDVYWNKCEPQNNFFKFTLFVSFFPQLMQGPISRYGDLSKTLYTKHRFDWKQVRFGLERVLWGYFKKLVIADRIGVAVTALTEDPEYYTGAFVALTMLFYAVQLYADFTGGIDITIGIAQSLGIRLEENFIRPYFSKNIAEYWRRWHITMGTWFRDYLFYPLSISRPVKAITKFCKKHFGMTVARRVPVYIVTILLWIGTGIWHGAAWFYVTWGLANGVIILLSEEFTPLYKKFHQKFPKLTASWGYRAFQVIRTFCLMCCLRLFDNYRDVTVTGKQFIHLFTQFRLQDVTKQELLDLGLAQADYIVLLVGVIILFLVSLAGRDGSVREKISKQSYIVRYAIYVILFFAVLLLGSYGVGFDSQQFIYNQF